MALYFQHFILIEFESEDAVKKVLESGSFGNNMPPVPSVSSFLWMRATSTKKSNKGAVCPDKLSDSETSPEELLQNMQEASSVITKIFFILAIIYHCSIMHRYQNKFQPCTILLKWES
jgi:hypothetical protein